MVGKISLVIWVSSSYFVYLHVNFIPKINITSLMLENEQSVQFQSEISVKWKNWCC